jgi:hypothetical protein
VNDLETETGSRYLHARVREDLTPSRDLGIDQGAELRANQGRHVGTVAFPGFLDRGQLWGLGEDDVRAPSLAGAQAGYGSPTFCPVGWAAGAHERNQDLGGLARHGVGAGHDANGRRRRLALGLRRTRRARGPLRPGLAFRTGRSLRSFAFRTGGSGRSLRSGLAFRPGGSAPPGSARRNARPPADCFGRFAPRIDGRGKRSRRKGTLISRAK